MCSQFEFEAGLMKGFFKIEAWLMKRVSLKWKLDFFSAGLIRSSKLTLCEYPARCSFRRNRSTRSLSAALAQPHHAGAAYRRRLIAVALHTVNSALSCNPFALRMRSAYVEEAHLLMI